MKLRKIKVVRNKRQGDRTYYETLDGKYRIEELVPGKSYNAFESSKGRYRFLMSAYSLEKIIATIAE